MASIPTPTAATVPRPAPLTTALVWGPPGAPPRTYPLFEAARVEDGGLFLAGPLFLEIGEEVAVELHLPDGPTRVRARVVQLVRGSAPGMRIALVDADQALMNRLREAAGAAG